MATRKIQQLTSWSFSRWSCYNTCPYKAQLKFIDKLKEPGSPQMDRGTAIHELAEHYVKAEIPRLPKELKLFKEEFTELRKTKAIAEEQWTFRKDWSLTEWNDWNGAWLRVKVDVHKFLDKKTLKVIDHKTGKFSAYKVEEYGLQLELTAAAAFQRYPEVQTVITENWFLDQGIIYPEEPAPYDRKQDAKKIVKLWERRAAVMLNATKFPAKPNRGCQWCHFRAANGGPCKHG